MNDHIEATVFVAWDETGVYVAHIDAVEVAEELARNSEGHFRRAVELRLKLPPAGPIVMDLAVQDNSRLLSPEVSRV